MSLFTPFAFVKSTAGPVSRAQAFINATGISGTDATAITTLVADLESYNLWDKFQAIYPFVGGTATSNKFNLINPVDSDAAFRLTFVGDVGYSSNGVTFNRVTSSSGSYANTNYNVNTNGSLNDQHISTYNRTAGLTSGFFLATYDSSTGYQCSIQFDPTRLSFNVVNRNEANLGSVADLQGYWLISRSNSTEEKHYYDGSNYYTNSRASQGKPPYNLTLGVRFENGAPQNGTYTQYNCAFATIGYGLDNTQQSNLYTAIQAFQTTLGRQV